MDDRPGVPRLRSPGAAAVAVAVVLALLPCRSRAQAASVAAFWIAMAVVWIWGRWALELAREGGELEEPTGESGPVEIRPGPLTTAFLGQFVLLLAAHLALPLNALLRVAAGTALPLPFLVWGLTLALPVAGLARRRRRAGVPSVPWLAAPELVVLLAGVGQASAVVAAYATHLSALGLDNHQHVYWAVRIVETGVIPLTESYTDIVSDYPKSFHLLSAVWNAAGLFWFMGPTVKALPFVQSWLPAMVVCEILVHRFGRDRGRTAAIVFAVAVASAFTMHAFILVPLAFPIADLIGTPRFSSNALLFLPLALVLLAGTYAPFGPALRRASLAAWPVVLAWAFTFNVAAGIVALAFVLPYWLALRAGAGPAAPRGEARRSLVRLAWATGAAAIVAAQDPAVAALLANRSELAAGAVARLGARTLERAAATGEVPPIEKYILAEEPHRVCETAGCLLRVASEAAATVGAQALRYPIAVAAEARDLARGLHPAPAYGFADVLGFRTVNAKPYGPPVLFLAPGLAVLVAAGARLARRARGASAEHWRLLAGVAAGTALGNLSHLTAGAFFRALRAGGEPVATLVAGYVNWSGVHLGLLFHWLPPVFALWVAATELVPGGGPSPGRAPAPGTHRAGRPFREADADRGPDGPSGEHAAVRWRTAAVAGLGLWLALAASAPRLEGGLREQRGFWDAIDRRDLAALRKVEARVPAGDAVLVPAEHRAIAGKENWVIPLGPTAALLPYARGRIVFNVFLGYSRLFGWQDLRDELCAGDRVRRARFLARANVRWLLLRAPGVGPRAVFESTRICGRSLEELGVVFPPVFVKRGQLLFAVR
jgi:hypothetical protein